MNVARQTSAAVRRAIVHHHLDPRHYPAAVAVLALRLTSRDLTATERAAVLKTVHRLAVRGIDDFGPIQNAVFMSSLCAALNEPYVSGNHAKTDRLLSMARIVIGMEGRALRKIADRLARG